MSLVDKIKARIKELNEARKRRSYCWPCEWNACHLVKEVTPYDKETCICCRNYHNP